MNNLSFSEYVTTFTIWEFLSELTKSYTQMDIYRAGIIDSRGKFLKTPDQYRTASEKLAGNPFNRLIVIIKRALSTSSDPEIRYTLTNPMNALQTLSEEVYSLGGDGQVFLDYLKPIIEEMSVGGGGISGVTDVSVSQDPENVKNVVVPPSAVKRHKARVKKLKNKVGRKLFEELLFEAKNRVVQTTGHMTHLGDFLYHGDPELAIKHLEASHRRFTGKTTPSHKMSLKADGGMSVVLKRHKDGTPAVAYKSGAEEFTSEDQIHATGKQHFVDNLVPALRLAQKMKLKPGSAVQGDILFTKRHSGIVQPNAIRYNAPQDAEIGFAPHSEYSASGLHLIKTTSHPTHERLQAAGAFVPNLAITRKTRLSLHPKRNTAIESSITAARKILSNKDVSAFARSIPQDKKFHRMLQEYSNEAARTSGTRTVKGLMDFIPVHMAKASQKNLSDKTKEGMVSSFHKTIKENEHHLGALFTAHGHINTAKHHLLDQFGEHHGEFSLKTHGGEEHEGFVSSLGRPGKTETQAKFVREGPGGFPEKNVANAVKRFGKPAEA